MTAAGRSPLVRQVVVTLTFAVCVVGSLIGVGVFGGTPVAEAAGGLLWADATHLAPASPAFSVWSLSYTALGAYTVWQWWDRTDERRVAWLVAASLVLNAAWGLAVQAGAVALAVVGRGRLATAPTLVWVLSWIAIGRATGDPESTTTAVAAVVAAAIIAVVTVACRAATAPRRQERT